MKPVMPRAVFQTMSASRLPLPPSLRAILAGLFAMTASLFAATGDFVGTLSADQQSAAGLAGLSATERSTLDSLVATDLAMVRQNPSDDNLGSFTARRTPVERHSAGLDRLSPVELEKLNEFVAAALAIRPKPKDRPRIKDDDVLNPAKTAEIHGSVSVMVGSGGRGGSFWGSSLFLDYFDPATGLGLSVGLSNFSGPGFYGYYPAAYGGSRLDPLYSDYSGFPSRGFSRNDFAPDDGRPFRAMTYWNSFERDHRRH